MGRRLWKLAGDADAPRLLGLGVRELSMGAPSIALVKRAVRTVDLSVARALAGRRWHARARRGARAPQTPERLNTAVTMP